MASDDALNHLLSRTEAGEYRPGDLEPGDTSRISIEAFVAGAQGSARELASEGDLRLHGAGVVGTSAELADVSRITGSWQKLISAVGGALEDVKSLRGRLPASVITRTTLVLSASPSPGSVILHVRPKTDPFAEVAPTGDVPMIDQPRPLADRASEAVIEVLAEAVSAGTESLDRLTAVMQDLGPRVGSSLVSFADALDKSDITLDEQ